MFADRAGSGVPDVRNQKKEGNSICAVVFTFTDLHTQVQCEAAQRGPGADYHEGIRVLRYRHQLDAGFRV